MPDYQQANRRFRVTTGAGPDALLLTGFRGTEGLSRLFHFELDLIAPLDAPADFAAVLGRPALVELDLPNGQVRYFHGIVNRFAQGRRDDDFIYYQAGLVPALWLLTKRVQSRIFQHKTAREILDAVLDGIPLRWESRGNLAARDYCTQYRESDFAFASRLMEEEGIYYYFTHSADGHELVLGDHPDAHDPLPVEPALVFEEVAAGAAATQEFRVTAWEKVQELRAGKVTLWDHNFELPHQHLDAEQKIPDTLRVGAVDHDLVAGVADRLERYDYPGGYAEWFDGVDPNGAEQPADLEKVFEQNLRLAELRMQEEAAGALRARGGSTAGNLTAGHAFTLTDHYDADGDYVLTRVDHAASSEGDYRSGAAEFHYANRFECLPKALPFRPPRETPRPTIKGTQTAVVVGPAGEEIFTDKYGRVKVQFHWDREGKYDPNSSCWVRVATVWAGKGWGVIHIPRIGHEVVVDFLEGDPDRPIVIGSVYNADHIPPGQLPKQGMISGLMSRTTPKGGGSNFNGMRADDSKGKEHLNVQAEYDMTTLVKHDDTQTVQNNRLVTVDGTHTETVKGDTSYTVSKGNFSHDVQTGTAMVHVKGAVEHKYDATMKYTVTGAVQEQFDNSWDVKVKNAVQIVSSTAHVHVTADKNITLHVGKSEIMMDTGGQIKITGIDIVIEGKGSVTISGGRIMSKAKAEHEIFGADVLSKASGNNVVKGTMVMLNPG